jgi:hypothetical protein
MSQEAFRYNPVGGLSNIDQILLRGARSHKSADELSAMTNGQVKPAEALSRVIDILDSRNVYTTVQKKALLIDDLMALKDSLFEKAVTFSSLDHAKPLIQVLTALDKALVEDKLDVSKAMAEISRAHAQMMLEAISLALERSFTELEKRHPSISQSELSEVFYTVMPEAVRSIESRVPSE